MSVRSLAALAAVSLLGASGCAHSHVGVVHMEAAGTDVVSGQGAVTVVHNNGKSSHACTRTVGGGGKMKGHRGRGGPPGVAGGGGAGGPQAMLDTLLFRLCEARGNEDLTKEQYAELVRGMMKSLDEMAKRPMMGMRPGMAGPQRGRRGGGRGEGRWRGEGRGGDGPGDGAGPGDGPPMGPGRGPGPRGPGRGGPPDNPKKDGPK